MLEADNTDPKKSPIGENAKSMYESAAGFKEAVLQMLEGADKLNQTFGQTRGRAVEMMKAVSDSALGITRLGGQISDVFTTLQDISESTGRNVIANSESAAKLYATSKVVGESVGVLVKEFANVGIQFNQIGEQMETATKYVRDMGLNTQQVMSRVVNNFEQLNRFNFSEGVQGMTKMAAKATMFRIDMREAFNLAEKVMSPEGAVEVASAFQRLGVAAGSMADPFALMNASINDPGALQDTIVNIGKQFTYFDDKTKSFKINPQGMLTLRELSKETGISYDELTKAGLAASELDKRLSEISPSIKFANEEDKMYLSNIAQMGKGGKYEVDMGGDIKKALSDLNQEEFDDLIKEQKGLNMPMEEVARKQLSTQDLIAADVRTIVESVTRGTAKTSLVTENIEGLRRVMGDILGPISSGLVKSDVVGKNLESITQSVRVSLKEMITKGGKTDFAEIGKILGDKFGDRKDEVVKIVKTMAETSYQTLKSRGGKADDSEIELLVSSAAGYVRDVVTGLKGSDKTSAAATTGKGATATTAESGLLGGLSPTEKVEQAKYGSQTLTSKVSQTVDFGGTITIKVEAPPGVSVQQLQEYVNSDELKRSFFNFIQKQLLETGQLKNKAMGTN